MRSQSVRTQYLFNAAVQNFTPFHALLIPLLNRLRKIVFPNDKPWDREDEKLYSRMREVLRQGGEGLK